MSMSKSASGSTLSFKFISLCVSNRFSHSNFVCVVPLLCSLLLHNVFRASVSTYPLRPLSSQTHRSPFVLKMSINFHPTSVLTLLAHRARCARLEFSLKFRGSAWCLFVFGLITAAPISYIHNPSRSDEVELNLGPD